MRPGWNGMHGRLTSASRKVVLPAPDAPMTAVKRPGSTTPLRPLRMAFSCGPVDAAGPFPHRPRSAPAGENGGFVCNARGNAQRVWTDAHICRPGWRTYAGRGGGGAAVCCYRGGAIVSRARAPIWGRRLAVKPGRNAHGPSTPKRRHMHVSQGSCRSGPDTRSASAALPPGSPFLQS